MMIIVCKNEGLYNFGNRYFWLMRSTIPPMEGGWGREGERERGRERERERESMNERFRGVLNRQHERIHMRGSGFIYFVRWAYNIFNPNANTHFMR
jgi:hypothetical protein